MALEIMKESVKIIQSLSDYPNQEEGLTAQEMKEKFDEAGVRLQQYLNGSVVPALNKKLDEDRLNEAVSDAVDLALQDFSPEKIGAAPDGYGLGTTTQKAPNDDPNEITKTGFYSAQHANLAPNSSGRSNILHIEGSGNYAIQFQFDLNESIYAVRRKLEGVWQAWEFENPPMAAGIEYRTTERWDNKPVYRKLVKHISEGVISGDSRYDIDHGISNIDITYGVQIMTRTSGNQLPYIATGESTAVTSCTSTKIQMRTTGVTSWSAGRTWYFDMKYVKTA